MKSTTGVPRSEARVGGRSPSQSSTASSGAWEPASALRAGPVGDEDLHTIVRGADEWLTADGVVVLEMAPDQTAPIAARLRTDGWQASVHQDLAGRDRAVVARKRS